MIFHAPKMVKFCVKTLARKSRLQNHQDDNN
jgi:hypothetical protein